MWQQCYSTERTVEDDFLIVKGSFEDTTFVLPPYGIDFTNLDKIIDKTLDYFKQNNLPFMMKGVPPQYLEVLEKAKPGLFQYDGDRDGYDYLYNAEDLINLVGRKYSRKRNHIHNFKKNHPDFLYLPLTENLFADCIRLTKEWCEKKDCDDNPSLECEKCAVITGLENFAYLELQGGAIVVNGRVEAFTFGEVLNEDTAVVHVEKGNPDIKGIYPVINQEFCLANWQQMKYINREEDLGLEGLRKAKESYFPVRMVEKYMVTLK